MFSSFNALQIHNTSNTQISIKVEFKVCTTPFSMCPFLRCNIRFNAMLCSRLGVKRHVGFPREGSENLIKVSSGPHVVFLTSDL